MACCETLEGVHIAERDHNGDVMLAWSYPGCDAALDEHVLRRCAPELERDAAGLAAALKHEGVGAVGIMFWTRFQANWAYVLPFAVGGATLRTARSKGAWAHTYSSRLACPGELTFASMRKGARSPPPDCSCTRAWVQ